MGRKAKRYEDGFTEPEICPVCGKVFIPAPQHVYKIGSGQRSTFVCSYSCVRTHEKEQEEKRKRRKKN